MSRATVRAAVAAFFAAPAVANLNKVYTSFPKRMNAGDFLVGQAAGTKSGAVAVIFVGREIERRVAMGGATSGKKRVDYDVDLEVFLRSVEQTAEAAMDAYDAVVDAIKVKLRTDRVIGAGATVFQAGEATLDGEHEMPRRTVDGTDIAGRVTFEVSEFLTT